MATNTTKTISFEIEIEGEKRVLKTFDDFKKAEKELSDQIEKTPIGSKKFNQLQGDLKKVQKEFDKAKIKSGGLSEVLGNIPGPIGAISQGFTGSIQGIKAFGLALKTAIITNPVGLVLTAIVAAVTALGKAFTSTKKGAETFQRLTAGIGAAMDVLRDVLVGIGERLAPLFTDPKQALIDFGTAIKDNIISRFEGILNFIPNVAKAVGELFKGNFKEAGKIAFDAVAQVTTGVEGASDKINDFGNKVKDTYNEVVEEATEASRLTGVLQEITDKERELAVARAEQNAALAETKLKVEDTNLSYEERIAALDEVGKKEQEQLDADLALQNEKLAALEALAAQSDSDAETLQQLADQRILIANLEEQSFNKQTEIAGKRRALVAQQAADEKAAADQKAKDEEEARLKAEEELQREKERVTELNAFLAEQREVVLEDQFRQREAEINAEEQAALDKLKTLAKNDEEYQRLKTEIEKKYGKQREENAKAESDYKIALQKEENKAKLDIVKQGLGVLQDVAAEGSAIGKAAAVASTTISTYEAAIAALGAKPYGPWNIAQAAIVTAAGINNVKKILQTKIPGGGSGTSNVTPPNIQTFNAENVLANNNQSLTNLQNAGEVITPGLNNEPIRAYVVATEVTSAQQANNEIENLSRL